MMSQTLASKSKKSPCVRDSHHLFDAVVKGKIHLTRFILAAANSQLQNSWDEEGRTPLIACCDIKEEGTRDQIVHILLEGGADVNMTDREGRSPLIHACEKRCNDIVRILVHHHHIKPDIEDVYGNTALIYSAAVGNDVATELLTRNFRRLGLLVDHYNKQGNTAILVAAKNGNMNCAKILAQKGRASVLLKDKEQGLTPMEWCLKEGYSKDEVEFLKPNTRFYRVAKLATSLSRSRSSVSSLSQEAKPKVSPSKSVDSCIGNVGRTQSKVSLTRSKSQTVDSSRYDPGGGSEGSARRESGIDVPRTNYHQLILDENATPSSVVPDMTHDDYDKNTELMKRDNTTTTSGSNAGVTSQECTNVPSVMTNRRFFPPDNTPYSSVLPESSSEHYSANNRCGRLAGLGCSLSTASVVTCSTSLGSSDGRDDLSRTSPAPENVSVSSGVSNVSDHSDYSVVRSNYTTESEGDEVFSQYGLNNIPEASRSEFVKTQSLRTGPCHTSVSPQADKSVHIHGQCGKASETFGATNTADVSPRQTKKRSGETGASVLGYDHQDDLPDGELMQLCSSQKVLQRKDDTLEIEDQFSEAGHNVLSLVTSAAASITQYDTQNPSSAAQESRIVPHVCSSQQISQDA